MTDAPDIYVRWGAMTLGPWDDLEQSHRDAWLELARKVAEADAKGES